MEHAWLRTRRGDDGSMELWVRGWRLEHRLLPIVPLFLGIAFLAATTSVGLVVRLAGSLSLLAVAFVCQRLTHTGLRITENAVTVVNLRATVWVPWREFVGFVGERSGQGGRCVLMIDELNLTVERYRKELAAVAGVPAASPGARRLSAGR